MKTGHRQGFTLVELLIVVSIIALLIGILLPALSEARRSARLVIDIANLREHGNGATAYAAENKGTMPNGKKFFNDVRYMKPNDPKLWPHWVYCGPFKTGGTAAAAGPSNGIGFNRFLAFGNTWKLYAPVFGNYIIDAQGVDLLWGEIFTSAGGNQRSNHQFFLRESKEFQGGTQAYLQDPSRFSMGINAGSNNLRKPYFGERGVDTSEWALPGTYRYTVSALVGDSNTTKAGAGSTNFFTGFRAQSSAGGGSPGAKDTPWAQDITWAHWRTYVKTASFTYPSQKVIFWDLDVEHSPTSFYTHPGAKVGVNMLDGSTKTITPYDVMPLSREDVLDAGVQFSEAISTRESYKPNWGVGVAVGGQEGYNGAPAWFAMTADGPKGRDLGVGAYIGLSER